MIRIHLLGTRFAENGRLEEFLAKIESTVHRANYLITFGEAKRIAARQVQTFVSIVTYANLIRLKCLASTNSAEAKDCDLHLCVSPDPPLACSGEGH